MFLIYFNPFKKYKAYDMKNQSKINDLRISIIKEKLGNLKKRKEYYSNPEFLLKNPNIDQEQIFLVVEIKECKSEIEEISRLLTQQVLDELIGNLEQKQINNNEINLELLTMKKEFIEFHSFFSEMFDTLDELYENEHDLKIIEEKAKYNNKNEFEYQNKEEQQFIMDFNTFRYLTSKLMKNSTIDENLKGLNIMLNHVKQQSTNAEKNLVLKYYFYKFNFIEKDWHFQEDIIRLYIKAQSLINYLQIEIERLENDKAYKTLTNP